MEEIKAELLDKHFARTEFNEDIEQHLARIKMKNKIDKLSPARLTVDNLGQPDSEFGFKTGFEPFSRATDNVRFDPRIPLELRKHMDRREPEMQNIYAPVFDEASR